MLDEDDLRHLRRCVEIAAEALEDGDEPFGSLLVSADGKVLVEDRNRVAGGDRTRHPEFALARWAAAHLTPEERRRATVYTSGSTARCAPRRTVGWGSGAIVVQQRSRRDSWRGSASSACAPQPVRIAADTGRSCRAPRWTGPALRLARGRVRALHVRFHEKEDEAQRGAGGALLLVAMREGVPLLFTGEDFGQTDVEAARSRG